MNKEEWIEAISPETGRMVAQDKIAVVLGKAVEIVDRTFVSGEPVKWQGFGSLIPKEASTADYLMLSTIMSMLLIHSTVMITKIYL